MVEIEKHFQQTKIYMHAYNMLTYPEHIYFKKILLSRNLYTGSSLLHDKLNCS